MTIKENWEQMAVAYDRFVSSPTSFSQAIEMPAVLETVGDLSGKTVLELGCGAGRFAFEFEKKGAVVVHAVDLSETMIALAEGKKRTNGSSVRFSTCSVDKLEGFSSASMDVVFASTLLHFIPDLKPVMQAVRRVLKPGGTVVFSLIHPVHAALYPVELPEGRLPEKSDYVLKYLYKDKRAYVQPWIAFDKTIENFLCYSYHHTLEDYFEAFFGVGLQLKALVEPQPPAAWLETAPNQYKAYMKAPNYLVVKLS